jgi:UDP-glucose 4-epimerase
VRAFVTGIAGFIGSHVAEELLSQGHVVTGCDDLSAGRAENVPGRAKWHRLSVQEMLTARGDVVIHLAGIAGARSPDRHDMWRQNLGAAAHALWLAQQAGARFIFASTAAAAKPLSSDYAHAKWASEQLVKAEGGTILRFANVYGPRQRDWGHEPGVLAAWQRAAREGRPLRVDGDGTQTRDFIHVADVARAVRLAASRGRAASGTIDICTGQQTSIRDAVSMFDSPIVPGDRAGDDPDRIVQDPEPARRLLGFTAATPFALGVAA